MDISKRNSLLAFTFKFIPIWLGMASIHHKSNRILIGYRIGLANKIKYLKNNYKKRKKKNPLRSVYLNLKWDLNGISVSHSIFLPNHQPSLSELRTSVLFS